MELKTLWLGLVISMGAFAVKTGLGWSHIWAVSRPRQRLVSSLCLVTSYAALFGLVLLLVCKIHLLAHYEALLPLWRNGMVLHWLTAAMLAVWGLVLLRRGSGSGCGTASSRAWLALVLPCPVCLSVVLMSAAALNLYFPDQALLATAGLFAAFMAIAALTALLARRGTGTPVASLGLAMLLVALYFMLCALLLPQFSEVSRVYRLTAYAAESRAADPLGQAAALGAVVVLLALGFFGARRNVGKIR